MIRTVRGMWRNSVVLYVLHPAGRIERGRIRVGEPHPDTGHVLETIGYRFVPANGDPVIESRTLSKLKRLLVRYL
jgi:hypothetical protein